jgi:hypothetical protein
MSRPLQGESKERDRNNSQREDRRQNPPDRWRNLKQKGAAQEEDDRDLADADKPLSDCTIEESPLLDPSSDSFGYGVSTGNLSVDVVQVIAFCVVSVTMVMLLALCFSELLDSAVRYWMSFQMVASGIQLRLRIAQIAFNVEELAFKFVEVSNGDRSA